MNKNSKQKKITYLKTNDNNMQTICKQYAKPNVHKYASFEIYINVYYMSHINVYLHVA